MPAPAKSSQVLAYHGTTRTAAASIMAGNPIRQSTNGWDWLGPGIYFWQDAPEMAAAWAQKIHSGQEVSVLEVEISLDRCFDLLDVKQAALDLLKEAWEDVRRTCESSGTPVPRQVPFEVNNGRCVRPAGWGNNRADCEMFRSLIAATRFLPSPFRSIRSAFLEGEGIHASSFVFDMAHVQLCVLDQSAITLRTAHDV